MLAPLTDADPRKVGRYWLQGRLGAGGMGTVYLGFDEDGHPIAVKVIRPELIGDADFRERFRREVAAARRVRGKFVAEVRDADVDAERPWMATEYVDGVSLAAAVGERGRLSGSMLIDLAASLADALAAIHAAGLVHRDLKPSNILLAWDGPKVIDFGVAHAVDTTEHTQTGHIIGTVAWMAPEQLRGERAGPAADIFSWAMCVAFAATGRHLFAADTPTASAIRMLREEPDLSGIPEGLTPLTLRALNRDPSRRPTAVELVTGIVRNYPDSVDLADQVTRRVLVTPPPPPPAASAPVADRAGGPRAADRLGGPAGHAVVTETPPGQPGAGHAGAVHPGSGHPGSGHAGVMRRWQLALVTVAAGIALGVTTGLVVAVAMRVAPSGNASLPGAMTTPAAGVPFPSGNATVPTAGGLWTPGPPASAGFALTQPPGAVAWTLSGQSTSTPLPPSAQPAQPAPDAENVAQSSPKEPTAPTEPAPTRTTPPPPATTTSAKPPQPPPTSPAPAPTRT
ncbi:serine/threonine-protein kinase, partial [Candidatus Protofrankia californiensis]|uniref:serine/threonine-protein kinase n=1 Tax=Candidatus Protofrankia californiensis TaxID=1839754 RepID=UPI0010411417